MSFDSVKKSSSSTPASRQSKSLSPKHQYSQPSVSSPHQAQARQPMTTAQWLQSALIVKTIQTLDNEEGRKYGEQEEQNGSPIPPQSSEQPDSGEKQPIKTKLTVGKPGDRYELEADSMAAKVMAMPDEAIEQPDRSPSSAQMQTKAMPSVWRSSNQEISQPIERSSSSDQIQTDAVASVESSCLEENQDILHAKEKPAATANQEVTPSLESRLANSKSGGNSMPSDVRAFMEPRFGADFSNVKVHTDTNAVQMNQELGAKAFAHGSDIYYGTGFSPAVDELTAHELTHTIQQGGAKKLQTLQQTSWGTPNETLQKDNSAQRQPEEQASNHPIPAAGVEEAKRHETPRASSAGGKETPESVQAKRENALKTQLSDEKIPEVNQASSHDTNIIQRVIQKPDGKNYKTLTNSRLFKRFKQKDERRIALELQRETREIPFSEAVDEIAQRSEKISNEKAKAGRIITEILDDLKRYLNLPEKLKNFKKPQEKIRESVEKKLVRLEEDLKTKVKSTMKMEEKDFIALLGEHKYFAHEERYLKYQLRKKSYEDQEKSTEKAKDDPQPGAAENLAEAVNEDPKENKPWDILKKYNYHWDRARDVLAYATGNESQVKRKQMETLVAFRSKVVLQVLNQAMIEVANKIPGLSDSKEFTTNSKGAYLSTKTAGDKPIPIKINAHAPGSSNLTSDYDVTFQIEKLPQYEAEIVEVFNREFRKYLTSQGCPGYESGIVFDTNVYTSGVFGSKGALYTPKTKEAQVELNKNKLGFSLVAILKGLPQKEWLKFEQEVKSEARDVLKINSAGMEIIRGLFAEAKSYVKTTSFQINKSKKKVIKELHGSLGLENNQQEYQSKGAADKQNEAVEIAAQMHAANRLYEQQIRKVSEFIKQYQKAQNDYRKAKPEEKSQKAEEIDKISLNIYKEQSMALIYANEAYYSAGPILHVVGEMQMKLPNLAKENEYLQSLLVQVGYKLQHIQHYQHLFEKIQDEQHKANKLDRVGLLFAKYGHRGIEATQKLETALQQVNATLDLTSDSIRNIAADMRMEATKKIAGGTPQEKVTASLAAANQVSEELVKDGHLDLKAMQKSWTELAFKVLARIPHLLEERSEQGKQ